MEAQERTDVGLFKRARDHFSETFGEQVEAIRRTSDGIEVAVGGMPFLFNPVGKTCQLWGECPKCGWHCWSLPIHTLSELGKMLGAFRPVPHTCGNPEVVEETVAETLRKALREFMEGEG